MITTFTVTVDHDPEADLDVFEDDLHELAGNYRSDDLIYDVEIERD